MLCDGNLLDIGMWLRSGAPPVELPPGECLGIVCPVYFWGVPSPVADFVRALAVVTQPEYVFSVVTYGSSTGGATAMIRNAMKERGIKVDASFIVKMVDVWTPMFNVSNVVRNRRVEAKADVKIREIASRITRRWRGNADCIRIWLPIAQLYYMVYRRNRSTRFFSVDSSVCTGCGLCVSNCPVHAISLRPDLSELSKEVAEFTSSECTACLRCLHHCPVFAIHRGGASVRHGQYYFRRP